MLTGCDAQCLFKLIVFSNHGKAGPVDKVPEGLTAEKLNECHHRPGYCCSSLGFIWGGTFYFTEIMLLAMTPFHIVFFRVSIAATFMLAFIHLRGKRLPTDAASIRQFVVMGLFNNALPFFLHHPRSAIYHCRSGLDPQRVYSICDGYRGRADPQ